MKTRTTFIATIVLVLATFFAPAKVSAADAQQLTLKIDSGFHDKNNYTMDVDANIYYSFYNKGEVALNISDNTATMTLAADEFTHGNKYFKTPAITFTGTYEHKGNKNYIELVGKSSGTSYNESTNIVNYAHITVDKITLSFNYKDGAEAEEVAATARVWGTIVSKNGDSPEKTTKLENSPLTAVKKFAVTATAATAPAETPTSKYPDPEPVPQPETKEENGALLPIIITTSTLVVIGGGAGIAIARYKKAKGADGREKTFEYNPETGEYENGDTILNTSNIEEVEKQATKDKAWQEKEREKVKNRDTLEDRENRKMVEDQKKNTKQVERDIYVDKVASKEGITAKDKKTIKKELAKKQQIKEKDAADRKKIVEHIDTTIDVTEKIVEGIDYAMTAGETLVPGGKAVSAGYKVLKGVGEVATDGTKNGGDIIEAVVTSSADAINTFATGKLAKAGTTIGANISGKAANVIYNDKSVGKAVAEGVKSGAASAVVGAVGDEAGAALGGKAGEAASNVAANAYQKHVVDPKMKK